jgi:hypothetical protein
MSPGVIPAGSLSRNPGLDCSLDPGQKHAGVTEFETFARGSIHRREQSATTLICYIKIVCWKTEKAVPCAKVRIDNMVFFFAI